MNATSSWSPHRTDPRGLERRYQASDQRAAYVLQTLGGWGWGVHAPPHPITGRSVTMIGTGFFPGETDLGRELARSVCDVALGHEPRKVYVSWSNAVPDPDSGTHYRHATVVFSRNREEAEQFLRQAGHAERIARLYRAIPAVLRLLYSQDVEQMTVLSDLTALRGS